MQNAVFRKEGGHHFYVDFTFANMNEQLQEARVFFQEDALSQLGEILTRKSYSKISILCDSNTHDLCLPDFLAAVPELPEAALEIIELEPGEDQKSLEVLAQLWDAFASLEMDRKSLLINLGGGVISDLGGFAAATYMRGIDCINFPTSLLAMVDASVGAKTGINFGGFKNRIGSFSEPLMVGILPQFLDSLPEEEFLSGWAEMLKHGLIADADHYNELIRRQPNAENLSPELLAHSVSIKAAVVGQDARETGLRKVLNFGHSIGHALESYYYSKGQVISHGYAIALGMQAELALSVAFADMDQNSAQSCINELKSIYPAPSDSPPEKVAFLSLLRGDKKNQGSDLKFVLLAEVGKAVYDVELPEAAAWQSVEMLFHA